MKRSSFARPAYSRATVPLTPASGRGVIRAVDGEVRAVEKDGEFRSEAWRRAVASLPCCWCFKDGPSQCAHVNHRGKAMAMKAPDCWTFPLCPEHHREFDQGRTLTKEQRREMADEWVILTIRALAQKGLVKA